MEILQTLKQLAINKITIVKVKEQESYYVVLIDSDKRVSIRIIYINKNIFKNRKIAIEAGKSVVSKD